MADPQFAPPAPPTTAEETDASWDDVISSIAKKYQVDPRLAQAVAKTESWDAARNTYNPQAVSPKGARGIFQLMPETAARHKVNLADPVDNIRGGIEELRDLLHANGSDVVLALRRYNASPQAPDAVTDPYVQKVLGLIKPSAQTQQQQQQRTQTTTPPPTDPNAPPAPSWLSQHPYLEEATRTIRAVPGMLKGVNDAAVRGIESLYNDPGGTLKRVGQGALAANKAIGEGIVGAVAHPIDTFNAAWGSDLNAKVRQATETGDYARAALEAKNIPLRAVGMDLGPAEEYARQGDYPRMLGATTDVGLNLAGPEAVGALTQGGLRAIPRVFKPRLPPNTQAAVDLGLAHGVPVSASVASGSGFAKLAEYITQSTPIGSIIAQVKERQTARSMDALGTRLAGGVHPTALIGSEAGESAMGALTGVRDAHAGDADAFYDALRQHVADPAHTRQVQVGSTPAPYFPPGGAATPIMEAMQLPVPTAATKVSLRPAYEDLARRRLLLNPAEERALNTLEHFMNAPEYLPLTQIEKDLGALKGITRQAAEGERNVHQGLAAKGVGVLQGEIDNVARTAGPDVITALKEARKSRAAQGRTQDVLDRLKGTYEEPESAFKRLITPGNIKFLRTVAREAPGEIPKIGRALLEDIFRKARGLEGGWKKMESIANGWEAMHPETKRLIYGNNAKDLDSFFLLGRKIAESPNASGTGRATVAGGMLVGLFTRPLETIGVGSAAGILSAALNTKAGVKLLTQGYVIQPGTVKAAAWSAAVAKMVAGATQPDEREGRAPRRPDVSASAAPPQPPGAQRGQPPPAPPGAERGTLTTLPPWARIPIPPPPAPPR